jgi:hypothetical protein
MLMLILSMSSSGGGGGGGGGDDAEEKIVWSLPGVRSFQKAGWDWDVVLIYLTQ